MAQFIYDLVNSQYFGILLIVWAIIDLIWIGRWRALIGRIGKLITKPWIFTKDDEPNEPPLYPRRFLEELALYNRSNSKDVSENKPEGPIAKWANAQRGQVFDEAKPLRSFGHLLFLAFFTFFLLADAISVANTLVVLQVITADLPPILQRFDLAVLGGALLSAIVGIWMFVEVTGNDSDFIDNNKLNDAQKAIIKGISLLVAMFAVIVMIAFAIDRLIAIGDLQSNPTVNIILSAILFGLVPLNSALAAAISFPEAVRGAIVLIYLLVFLVVGILPVLAFILDILWRLGYIFIDVSIWALFTPIIIIPYGIGRMAGWISPAPRPTPIVSPESPVDGKGKK